MPRLSRDVRNQVIRMVEAGMPVMVVARRLNVNRNTIGRVISRHRRTGDVGDGPRTGRPRVTTPAQDRFILNVHLRY